MGAKPAKEPLSIVLHNGDAKDENGKIPEKMKFPEGMKIHDAKSYRVRKAGLVVGRVPGGLREQYWLDYNQTVIDMDDMKVRYSIGTKAPGREQAAMGVQPDKLEVHITEYLTMKRVVPTVATSGHTACIVVPPAEQGKRYDMQHSELWTWGRNECGQLGHGHTLGCSTPLRVSLPPLAHRVLAVATGGAHTLCLAIDDVYSWGANELGQLGHGDRIERTVPSPVRRLSVSLVGEQLSGDTVATISAGGLHSAVLTLQGQMFTWGCGANGRLGHGDELDQLTPTIVFGGSSMALRDEVVQTISCGTAHTLATTKFTELSGNISKGRLFSWGSGANGRLGHGNREDVLVPQRVYPATMGMWLELEVVSAVAGGAHSMCLTAEGVVHAWGQGKEGQLGMGKGDLDDKWVPVPLTSFATGGGRGGKDIKDGPLKGKTVLQIAAGCVASAAIVMSDIGGRGELWTWGCSFGGQLGHAQKMDQLDTTIYLDAGKYQKPSFCMYLDEDIAQVVVGDNHMATVASSGQLYTWGKARQLNCPLGHGNMLSPSPRAMATLGDLHVPKALYKNTAPAGMCTCCINTFTSCFKERLIAENRYSAGK